MSRKRDVKASGELGVGKMNEVYDKLGVGKMSELPKAKKGSEIMDEIHELETKGYGIGSRIHRLLEEKIDGKFIVDKEFVAQLEAEKKRRESLEEIDDYARGYDRGFVNSLFWVLEAFR